ncbi:hypothetical protein [Plantactinospora sp. B5E13]|uniref:hypothetical protein n=1 Tax=Plantactinospora sp. B5E13 TaxID=3153758 RepID=UPI00325C66E8
MTRYEPVPLPTGAAEASRAEVTAGVVGWVCAPPLRDLVAAFGGGLPDRLPPAELLEWLDGFSAVYWDFRSRSGSVERDEINVSELPPETVELVGAAATALGLVEPRPAPTHRYDHLLVLGGLARSCLHRTAYAAELVRGGDVTVDEVAALGSFRPLRPAETADLDLPESPGAPLGYEVDVMDVGIRLGFGYAEPAEERASTGPITHHSWAVRSYRPADGPPVHVLAAPSTEPETRRAHTSDTYHFWADEVRPAAGDRVLVVTSQLYVPFQHCDAVRSLRFGYGCRVDTVGLDPARLGATGGTGPQRYAPHQYLQEIRSTVRSMRNLLGAA